MSKWNAEKCWRWCATCSPDSLEDCQKCWRKTAEKEGCEYCPNCGVRMEVQDDE